MRTTERVEPELFGPDNRGYAVAFVHGLGVDGHGRISADEPISAIDLVANNLHEIGVPTAHINLGTKSDDGLTRFERTMEQQTDSLSSAIDTLKQQGFERVAYIAQSIGAAVVTRHLELHPEEVTDVHLWAPPTYEQDGHSKRLTDQFAGDSRSHIDTAGESRIHCRGDVELVVPPEYWADLDNYSVHVALSGMRRRLNTVHAFFASQDKLYPGGINYYSDILQGEEMTVLEGDSHTFRYQNMRDELVQTTLQLVRSSLERT